MTHTLSNMENKVLKLENQYRLSINKQYFQTYHTISPLKRRGSCSFSSVAWLPKSETLFTTMYIRLWGDMPNHTKPGRNVSQPFFLQKNDHKTIANDSGKSMTRYFHTKRDTFTTAPSVDYECIYIRRRYLQAHSVYQHCDERISICIIFCLYETKFLKNLYFIL